VVNLELFYHITAKPKRCSYCHEALEVRMAPARKISACYILIGCPPLPSYGWGRLLRWTWWTEDAILFRVDRLAYARNHAQKASAYLPATLTQPDLRTFREAGSGVSSFMEC